MKLRRWLCRLLFRYHRDQAAAHLQRSDYHQTRAAYWAARHHAARQEQSDARL